ncbi:hypothetical protein Godav_025119 [Gossypium davidsonii]|uniref:Uncharacterized protein n=2 Tax=Gossypium TaxID=3633 RepID=A0A7J8T865_GOSDV|nr:hypothetical protein [Gossypium davidsonii]MBA0656003.1 hypothetical protein [Gossypium klotzschianum]
MKTSNGRPLGWSLMRFCRGNLYRQRKGWLSVSLRIKVIITRRRFVKYRNAWSQTHRMKRFAANPMTTPEYD